MNVPPDVEIQKQLTSVHIDEWLKDDLWQLRWWCLIVVLALMVFVWYKLIDKSKMPQIILYAGIATIAFMAVFEYGNELTLWEYPTDIIPIFPPLSSINLISMPLIYSLIYQYFRTWKDFIVAVLIATAVSCFVIEPLLVLTNFFELSKWKHYYNYPIFAVLAIAVRYFVLKTNSITERGRR